MRLSWVHLDGRFILAGFLLLFGLVAACAPPPPQPPPRPASPAMPTPTPTPGAVVTPAPSGPSEVLAERARADAAARMGVPQGQARVVSIEPREWNDSSLGCPAPGMAYAQVITPGYLIVVEASGRHLEYHSNRGSRLVLCDQGRPVDVAGS